MGETKIAWCDTVWNPTTGCTFGCSYCYARRMAKRLQAIGQPHYKDGFAVRTHTDALDLPLHWKKPRRIFVDSMGDLFDPEVPFEFVVSVWATMYDTTQHTYMILTKRPERLLAFFDWVSSQNPGGAPLAALPNVWLGVSVENQAAADERIPLLLQVPAAVRFVSCEPLLGAVDLTQLKHSREIFALPWNALRVHDEPVDHGVFDRYRGLDWVIAGGESGPGARPMHPDWARSLRDQCQTAGVPFFFKQWGESIPRGQQMANEIESLMYAAGYEAFGGVAPKRSIQWDDQHWAYRVGKKAAGDLLDGKRHQEFPT